jgi:hypothetical protein
MNRTNYKWVLKIALCSVVAVNWSELFDRIVIYMEQLIFHSASLFDPICFIYKFIQWCFQGFETCRLALANVSEFTVTVQFSCCAWVNQLIVVREMVNILFIKFAITLFNISFGNCFFRFQFHLFNIKILSIVVTLLVGFIKPAPDPVKNLKQSNLSFLDFTLRIFNFIFCF